jgi:inorganic pyrophosphatase
LPCILRSKIEYFFRRYKDLEPKAWSEVLGWDNCVKAEEVIMESIKRAKK